MKAKEKKMTESKKDNLGVIIFALVVLLALIIGASYSSNQSDQTLNDLAPQYKVMTTWWYLAYYPVAIFVGLILLGLAALFAIWLKKSYAAIKRERLSRRINQVLHRGQHLVKK